MKFCLEGRRLVNYEFTYSLIFPQREECVISLKCFDLTLLRATSCYSLYVDWFSQFALHLFSQLGHYYLCFQHNLIRILFLSTSYGVVGFAWQPLVAAILVMPSTVRVVVSWEKDGGNYYLVNHESKFFYAHLLSLLSPHYQAQHQTNSPSKPFQPQPLISSKLIPSASLVTTHIWPFTLPFPRTRIYIYI